MGRAEAHGEAETRAQRLVPRAVREFLETETSGGIVLAAAIGIALIWANSPLSNAYSTLWHTRVAIEAGPFGLEADLREWANDGLMVIFFFVVGLEIKRELAVGDLSTVRKAMLPAIAAAGGMIVPAGIYLAFNAGGEASRGWGIPMATDIALALGALALVGPSLPHQARVFLLSLAIVDDIGAVIVIALFYTSDISVASLAIAIGLLGLVVLMRWLPVWWIPAYVVAGTGVWLAVLQSGVHPTVAGVALGLLAPARPLSRRALKDSILPQRDEKEAPSTLSVETARLTRIKVTASVPVTERLAHVLHPWTSFVILPLFALANAGVELSMGEVRDALRSPVTVGIVGGLVVGKIAGITGFSWAARKLGASLPDDVGFSHVLGLAGLAGIGFTMSLFIATLALGGQHIADAKVGILAASLVATLVGALALRVLSSTDHR